MTSRTVKAIEWPLPPTSSQSSSPRTTINYTDERATISNIRDWDHTNRLESIIRRLRRKQVTVDKLEALELNILMNIFIFVLTLLYF